MIDKLYFGKIGLGMVGIFVVGLLVIEAFDSGKSKVMETIGTDSPITVPLFGMAFQTSKGELGSLQSLQLVRSAPDKIESFKLKATLNDGVDVNQFADCEVTIADPEHFDKDSRFTCLTEADSGFDDLVNFGTITFEPSGQVHRLMVPAQFRNRIQSLGEEQHGASIAAANAAGESVDAAVEGAIKDFSMNASPGHVTMMLGDNKVMDIRGDGDSDAGRVLIRDPRTGKVLVDITGSSAGGKLEITTPDGKRVIKTTSDSN